MSLRRVLVLLPVLALAAACGGGSPRAMTSHVPLTSLEQRAALTGCTPMTLPLTVASATCTFGSEQISLATFDTSGHRDLWVLASRGAGGGTAVKGDGWAATVVDGTVAADLAAALGGTVA